MKKILTTIIVLLLAAVIIVPRFYHLGSQPPGLHIDEVSFAADAKAIAETGRDTWNEPWPVVFKAFGEWKAPGLTYSMALWSKILGRMDTTVARLPSAIAGLTIILLLALTLRTILPTTSFVPIGFTVFALAFSPWHFDMSRIFYEAFSALAIFSISLYFLTRITLSQVYNAKLWLLATIFAAMSGYFYASIRLVVILSLIVFVVIQTWSFRTKLKAALVAMLVIATLGAGWIGDLFSERGLNRLTYYENKAAYGASLEIDEKRQFCYLSFDRNEKLSKLCYLIWNKPVEKITTASKTYLTYLGTDYLFLKAESEYGFDSQYGAFLYPLLPLYLIGLFVALSGFAGTIGFWLKHKLSQVTPVDRFYAAIVLVTLISLSPSALAGNINMRMSLISLYIVALLVGIGAHLTYTYLSTHLNKLLLSLVAFLYLGLLLFYIIQSLSHYFLVFTRSNDLMWSSDAPAIFAYVKTVSPQYDRIVDTELHGPLAPYFYGDIKTEDVQSGAYSPPDALGFTYLIQAGKYELKHIGLRDLACEKLSHNDKRRTLVITSPVEEFASSRKYAGKSWNGALLLHEVYDLDDIIASEIRGNVNYITRCGPKSL